MWACLSEGLRGAMAFALAISQSQNEGVENRTIFSTTLVIVTSTVILCGGLTTPMLQWLKIRSEPLPVSLSLSLSIPHSLSVSACLSSCMSVYLCLFVSVSQYMSLSASVSVCLSLCLCSSVSLSVSIC